MLVNEFYLNFSGIKVSVNEEVLYNVFTKIAFNLHLLFWVITGIDLTNIHEQIKQRHWCKKRHVPCARMRCSSTQVFRLAECYVPRWTLQCSQGNIEYLSLRFFKMRLHYLTICKNIPAWKYKKKILSIIVCRQNIWHFQTISMFLMRIWWLV